MKAWGFWENNGFWVCQSYWSLFERKAWTMKGVEGEHLDLGPTGGTLFPQDNSFYSFHLYGSFQNHWWCGGERDLEVEETISYPPTQHCQKNYFSFPRYGWEAISHSLGMDRGPVEAYGGGKSIPTMGLKQQVEVRVSISDLSKPRGFRSPTRGHKS